MIFFKFSLIKLLFCWEKGLPDSSLSLSAILKVPLYSYITTTAVSYKSMSHKPFKSLKSYLVYSLCL